MRWCWVNFQCRGVLLIRNIVGPGPTALAVGADGGCFYIFSLVYYYSLSPSLWETARYRLKYCFKGPLSPKQQPTNRCIQLQCMIGSKVNILSQKTKQGNFFRADGLGVNGLLDVSCGIRTE